MSHGHQPIIQPQRTAPGQERPGFRPPHGRSREPGKRVPKKGKPVWSRESDVWQAIREKKPAHVMMRRIEDRSGNLGTFDVFCAWHGITAWIELKYAGPKAKPELRPGQAAFATNLRDAGVPCGYVVGAPDGSVRLLGPRCRGKSWDDDLIAQWPTLDVEAVLGALVKNGV